MATNDTNIINITNMPQAQDIVDGNFLIVQNDLGTQIIDWSNVPVLKLDAADGAAITSLTASNISVSNCNVNSLTASAIYSTDGQGQTQDMDFYNRFAFSNGILVSADYIIGSPEYEELVSTIIPEATAYSANIAMPVFEVYAAPVATITTGNYTSPVVWTVLPSNLQYSDITNADCNISYTGGVVLSTTPFLCAFGVDGNNNLIATLCLRQAAPADMETTDFIIKVSKHYEIA